MRILSIGNSFSDDATRYLAWLARADGVYLEVANLVIGGAPLSLHHQHMLDKEKAYFLCYNGIPTGFYVSLEEALFNRPWDVITLQQASHESFDATSYQPYISELAVYIREKVPSARLVIHETWAYEANSERLHQVAGYSTPEEMLRDVVNAYRGAAESIQADGIIPSGELFFTLLNKGVPRVHRDTFHASLGLGRYALGLLWYRMLCGKSVSNISYEDFDEPVDSHELQIAVSCIDSLRPICYDWQ